MERIPKHRREQGEIKNKTFEPKIYFEKTRKAKGRLADFNGMLRVFYCSSFFGNTIYSVY